MRNRFKAIASIPPTRATPRPANATLPSANFTAFAGHYTNPGYGDFELCLVQPQNPSASTSCQALAANLSTILPNATRPGIPTFFGAIDSPWFSHMRIEHFNGNIFNVSLLYSLVSFILFSRYQVTQYSRSLRTTLPNLIGLSMTGARVTISKSRKPKSTEPILASGCQAFGLARGTAPLDQSQNLKGTRLMSGPSIIMIRFDLSS